MSGKTVFVMLSVLLPGMALGQGAVTYQCSFENLQRRIQILSEPGVSVPCEVHYYKDSEMPGQKQVLWTANSEEGYCERKTDEFVAKLREWGWQCDAAMADVVAPASADDAMDDTAEAAPAADEAMTDDTGALEPAEE